jgi:hypothetical protein
MARPPGWEVKIDYHASWRIASAEKGRRLPWVRSGANLLACSEWLDGKEKRYLVVGATGHYRLVPDEPAELVCVVRTEKGLETVSLDEFKKR